MFKAIELLLFLYKSVTRTSLREGKRNENWESKIHT